ncbi:PIN domain-like protein [Pholiota molesta]|nr:PIN domain-like protein [Pholiota molesta]
MYLQALSPASHTRTLTQIAVSEGFQQKHRPERCLLIGVDASVWMNQAQLAVKNRKGRGTRNGENPAVRNLFYRLCHLLTLPVIPIFVFDGPNRPSKKRGTAVRTVRSHWLTLPFQKFIEAFGFYWYMAPGEAEADLVELNRKEKIDMIVSEDSDTMALGACCVIRLKNTKDDGDQVTVFDAKSIQNHPDVLLDHAGLFLMAILCGGDYDNTGLIGCGWKTASRLARTELAHSLFNAATSLLSREDLCTFLCEWREAFRILLAQDPNNVLGRKYPSLASNVTDEFPPVDILLLYAHPVTSWSMGSQTPDQSLWRLRQPDLPAIGTLCEKYFSWGSSGDMVASCKGTLWPGVAIRSLLVQVKHYANGVNDSRSVMNIHPLEIVLARLGPGSCSTQPDVIGYTAQVFTHNILRGTITGLDIAARSLILNANNAPKIPVWVPGSILQSAVPDLLEHFKGKRPATPPTYPSVCHNISQPQI